GRPLRGRGRGEGAREVRLADLPGPAEALECRQSQHTRALGALDLPEPLHHEVEVGRLDPGLCRRSLRDASATARLHDGTGDYAGEDGFDERRLDREPFLLGDECAVALDRADDGAPSGRAREVVEPETVREQPG